MRKRVSKFKQEHKKAFFIILAVLAVIVILSWVKIGLYLNFLLGNDVLIKMKVDKDRFFITNGNTEEVNVEASVRTNPFCTAYCTMSFRDLTKDKVIDQEEFELKTGMPYTKKYTITNSNNMHGQDLYSVRMDCYGEKSFLCHTEEATTRRDIIITLNHELNQKQQEDKIKIKQNLERIKSDISSLVSTYKNIKDQNIIDNFNVEEWDEKLKEEEKDIEFLRTTLIGFEKKWHSQKFNELSEEIERSRDVINSKISNSEEINKQIISDIEKYNGLIDELENTKQEVIELKNSKYTNISIFNDVKSLINNFNSAVDMFGNKDNLKDKESAVEWINSTLDEEKPIIDNAIKFEVLEREIETDINYDILCSIDSAYCTTHPGIDEREEETEFSVEESCQYSRDMLDTLSIINSSIKDYVNSTYPDSNEFWQNVSNMINNKKRTIILNYISQLDNGSVNYDELIDILDVPTQKTEPAYSVVYIKNALLWQLIKEKPDGCSFKTGLPNVDNVSFTKINIVEDFSSQINISFDEPKEQCCLFKECYDCCVDEGCYNNEDNYPVIFVHGHAFNKGISAEYSLDVFNELQDTMEKDGYVSAGSINLYAEQENYYGKWSKIPLPMTIKVSYYYDLLQEEGNYQIIQTKSENIETYSLRLKEIIDIVKSKTRRPKVVVIAHSMGGLVVRRYLQIFGEQSVDKVVFVGTPHKGITGEIKDLCPLFGEGLECRDMTEGSVFMRKLELGGLPEIKSENIVGTGCIMDGLPGDGIVLKKKALVQGLDNNIVNGSCSGTNFLHSGMLNVKKYPEVYRFIKEGLR
jgi:hypothetical protein